VDLVLIVNTGLSSLLLIVSSDACYNENNCNAADDTNEQQFYVVSASGEPLRNGWGIY
jgi:hypothetical protein